MPFLDKFGPKTQNYEILKINSKNSKLSNLVHKLIQVCRIPWWCSLFLILTGSTFSGRCDSKNQNFQFELKFCTYNNLNMQNSMMVFSFSVLNQKNLFGVNLVHKIKIVSLRWNLVPRLIRICGIQWWCSLLLFLTINIPGQIWSKNRKLFKVKFDKKTNSDMQNSMVVSVLSVLDRISYPFWANLVQKIKIASSSWKLVLRLIRI